MKELINANTSVTSANENFDQVGQFIRDNLESICRSNAAKEHTQLKYMKETRIFLAWLGNRWFSIDSVNDYRKHLEGNTSIANVTKNISLAALRNVCKELFFREIVTKDLSVKLPYFKIESGHKKDGFDMVALEIIQEHIDGIENELQRARLNAMFTILTIQGLRQFEMLNLQVSDYVRYEKKLRIQGKGRTEKETITCFDKTMKALDTYLRLSEKRSGYIFTSEGGTTKGEKLTERGLRKIFEKLFSELKLREKQEGDKRYNKSTHGFRHFFVTYLLKKTNGNVTKTMHYSRHKSTAALVMYNDGIDKVENDKEINSIMNF